MLLGGWGKYGKMFTLTLTGTETIDKLTFEAIVVSDTGVTFTSEPTVVQNKNDDDNTGDSGDGTEGEGPLDPGTPEDPNEPGNDDIENKPDNPGDNTGGEGNEGDDTITNNGTVNSLYGEEGNDTITNNNAVSGNIYAGAGNDSIENAGTVASGIYGNDGTDKLKTATTNAKTSNFTTTHTIIDVDFTQNKNQKITVKDKEIPLTGSGQYTLSIDQDGKVNIKANSVGSLHFNTNEPMTVNV